MGVHSADRSIPASRRHTALAGLMAIAMIGLGASPGRPLAMSVYEPSPSDTASWNAIRFRKEAPLVEEVAASDVCVSGTIIAVGRIRLPSSCERSDVEGLSFSYAHIAVDSVLVGVIDSETLTIYGYLALPISNSLKRGQQVVGWGSLACNKGGDVIGQVLAADDATGFVDVAASRRSRVRPPLSSAAPAPCTVAELRAQVRARAPLDLAGILEARRPLALMTVMGRRRLSSVRWRYTLSFVSWLRPGPTMPPQEIEFRQTPFCIHPPDIGDMMIVPGSDDGSGFPRDCEIAPSQLRVHDDIAPSVGLKLARLQQPGALDDFHVRLSTRRLAGLAK